MSTTRAGDGESDQEEGGGKGKEGWGAKNAAVKKTAAKKAVSKKVAAKKAKRKPSTALLKAMTPSALLAEIVGAKPIPRGQIIKMVVSVR